MAKIDLMYPIARATGNMGSGRFRETKNGSTLVPRPQRTDTKHTLTVRPKRLACLAWKYADLLYQLFSQRTKDRWRAATKNPTVSCYDLWMKECLTLWNKNEYAPWTPSKSGGHTLDKAVGDSLIWPPDTDGHIAALDRIIQRGLDPFNALPDPVNLRAYPGFSGHIDIYWDPPAVFTSGSVGLWLTYPLRWERSLHLFRFNPIFVGYLNAGAFRPGEWVMMDFFFWKDYFYQSAPMPLQADVGE